jgi:membrane-associated phospholipid phosphatase
MESVLNRPVTRPALSRESAYSLLTPAELVAVGFFAYLALLGCFRAMPSWHRLVLCALPIALWRAWRFDSALSRPWVRMLRQWSCLGLILLAYWLLEWFSAPPLAWLQVRWLEWDRTVLDALRLRSAVEVFGPVLPDLLETLYLGLYAIPVSAMLLIFFDGSWPKVSRFLFILFLGTFTVYALIPVIRVYSPRQVFPTVDLPTYSGIARTINTWVLDRLDISTGVFPSGHVAVAFSSAFGLMSVLPQRRMLVTIAFAIATCIFVATIYGRYHYAADGLASIVIATAAWRIGRRV